MVRLLDDPPVHVEEEHIEGRLGAGEQALSKVRQTLGVPELDRERQEAVEERRPPLARRSLRPQRDEERGVGLFILRRGPVGVAQRLVGLEEVSAQLARLRADPLRTEIDSLLQGDDGVGRRAELVQAQTRDEPEIGVLARVGEDLAGDGDGALGREVHRLVDVEQLGRGVAKKPTAWGARGLEFEQLLYAQLEGKASVLEATEEEVLPTEVEKPGRIIGMLARGGLQERE